MKIFRNVTGCLIMHKINNDHISRELEVMPILDKIEHYGNKGKDKIEIMN